MIGRKGPTKRLAIASDTCDLKAGEIMPNLDLPRSGRHHLLVARGDDVKLLETENDTESE